MTAEREEGQEGRKEKEEGKKTRRTLTAAPQS